MKWEIGTQFLHNDHHQVWRHLWINQSINRPTNQPENVSKQKKIQGAVEQSCELLDHIHHHRIILNISDFAVYLKKKFNISWQVLIPW